MNTCTVSLGKIKGREEGIKQGIEKIAKNMLNAGMPEQTVMTLTGLNK